ncbi:hypothetical protein ANO11243_047720 [Dothideomycetidae sp. 11243]|nr:hypothetical protein ANO11243_047720 [fungal sp. No.11243]
MERHRRISLFKRSASLTGGFDRKVFRHVARGRPKPVPSGSSSGRLSRTGTSKAKSWEPESAVVGSVGGSWDETLSEQHGRRRRTCSDPSVMVKTLTKKVLQGWPPLHTTRPAAAEEADGGNQDRGGDLTEARHASDGAPSKCARSHRSDSSVIWWRSFCRFLGSPPFPSLGPVGDAPSTVWGLLFVAIGSFSPSHPRQSGPPEVWTSQLVRCAAPLLLLPLLLRGPASGLDLFAAQACTLAACSCPTLLCLSWPCVNDLATHD